MKLFRRLYKINQFKKVNANETTDTSNLVKKLTMTQKIVKLKQNFIMIIINMLLRKNLIN